MIVQARKRHFRKTNTLTFDVQFFAIIVAFAIALDSQFAKLIEYNILKRVEMIRLTCNLGNGLSVRNKLWRRL